MTQHAAASSPAVDQRRWWNRNWKWVVPLGCLVPVLVCGGFFTVVFMFVFGMIKQSEPYTRSLEIVQLHSEAQRALGRPIEAAFMVSGGIEVDGPDGWADFEYSVSGPNGRGIVTVEATRSGGEWTLQTLTLHVRDTREQINLLIAAPD